MRQQNMKYKSPEHNDKPSNGDIAGSREGGPVVMQVLPAMETGGAEQGCLDIHKELVRAGAKSIVVCNGGPRIHEIQRAGGHYIQLPVESKNPLQIRKNTKHLQDIIRQFSVDIVHARSRAPAWSCLSACRAEKTKFVTTCHAPYNAGNALKRRYNSVMAMGDRVIAISEYVAQYLRDNHNVPDSALRVIHRGIPVENYHPTSVSPERMIQLSKAWRLPEEASIILLPGRLTRWKGQHILIRAMARIENPNAFAVILGADQGRQKYRRELESLIAEHDLQDRIRLVDHCNDMPAAYMLSTLVVSASTDPEGFGRVPVEAMAMGRIAIATDHGAARETVVSGETGWLVPPDNVTSLAKTIDKSLSMPEPERVRMATRGMKRVEEMFSREDMVNKTFDVYAELLRAEAVS